MSWWSEVRAVFRDVGRRVAVTPARQMCSARGELSAERCAQWNAIHIQYGRRWGSFPLFSLTFIMLT